MSTSLSLLIGVGWLIVGFVNIRNGAHWSFVVFDFVLFLVFVVLGVRKAVRAGEEDDKKNKKK